MNISHRLCAASQAVKLTAQLLHFQRTLLPIPVDYKELMIIIPIRH